MTLRDMLDSGIEVQGDVDIKIWSEEKQSYFGLKFEKALDMEIKFLYSEQNRLTFEMRHESEDL